MKCPVKKKQKFLEKNKGKKTNCGIVQKMNVVMSGESGLIIKKCCVAVAFSETAHVTGKVGR